MTEPTRTLTLEERPEIPWLSVVLGYGPMLPFAAAAVLAWTTDGVVRSQVVLLTVIWSAAILAFLAGVRRGLSFRTQGGPAIAQIVTMFCIFVLALAALFSVVEGFAGPALVLLVIGFAAIALLDPIAARRGEAPLFFARLRPTQIPIAVVALAAMLVNVLLR